MWITFGLLAASSFGIAALFQKLAARTPIESSPWEVLILQGIATILVGAIGFFATKQFFTRQEMPAYLWGSLTGVMLAVGALFIFLTYREAGAAHADVSRIQALINTNTLIAVILGLVLLKEYTHLTTAADWARLIIGAALVVLGGVLVSAPPKSTAATTPEASARCTPHERCIHPHATHTHPRILSAPKLHRPAPTRRENA